MPPSLMSKLREATASAHEEIEREMEMEKACRDPASYRQRVEAFLGFYEPLERELIAQGEIGAYRPAEREKTPALRRDLRALGLSEEQISALPRCQQIPAVNSPADALGCAYVLEGATLGGRVIMKWLEAAGVSPEARSFFNGYGEKTGERWSEFRAVVDEREMSDTDDALVIESANATFKALQKWLAR